jgi:hypothetical protein
VNVFDATQREPLTPLNRVDCEAGLSVSAQVEAHLTWDYSGGGGRFRALYEHANRAQWNPSTDIDWSLVVPFGEALPDDSAFVMQALADSPLGGYDRRLLDRFRWEFQCYMVSQFLHAEQGAVVATCRLAEVLPDVEAKYCAAGQILDEARHTDVFARYLREHTSGAYPVSPGIGSLLRDTLADSRWDITALGTQMILEPLALAAFRLGNTFHDDLIRQITGYVARDEARHVAFGIALLQDVYARMSSRELREREVFALEAAAQMTRRLLLEELWDRFGVARDEGTRWAATNPMMATYKQAVFARIVSGLARVGLLTPRVREGLATLGVLGTRGRSLENASRAGAA